MSSFNASAISSDLLRSFAAVAEAGNVTQAAREIGRTQSAVSLQIQRLEGLLKVRLFERIPRGVRLTEEGRRLLPAARRALVELERVGSLFLDPLEGRIRVGIPDDYNEVFFQKALALFSARHRGVEIFVRSGCTAAFPEALRRGELDLAIYSAAPLEGERPFFVEPTYWVAGPSFQPAADQPLPLAVYDRDCPWRDAATAALDRSGLAWRPAYLSANYTSVKAAIASGLAVGYLARSAIEPDFRILGEAEGFPPLPDSLLYLLKGAKAEPPAVREMEAAIRAAVQ